MDELQTPVIKAKEELKNLARKLSAETNNLAKHEEEEAKHESLCRQLDDEITNLKKQEAELESNYEALKSGSTNDDVVLSDEQELEYERVREAAAVASAKPRSTLHQIKEKLEAARRKAGDIEAELKEVNARKEESAKTVHTLIERKETLNKVNFVIF